MTSDQERSLLRSPASSLAGSECASSPATQISVSPTAGEENSSLLSNSTRSEEVDRCSGLAGSQSPCELDLSSASQRSPSAQQAAEMAFEGSRAAPARAPSEPHKGRHLQSQRQAGADECDEKVKQVELFGVRIVALTINGRERLCLAQISNTLLKQFSYNEIHNRRVALGITCVQCTPIQLEMLRRAGAMPSSSRRCGMITMREAERLCRSFLVEEQPPELPENFYFTVAHRINYGCKGRFVPARYISSRAKCIECFYCGEFYSPNKFIFHSHKQPNATDCNPPDSPNINSWRKHIDLDLGHEQSQEIKYAWEDVKSLFNGGTRRRAPPCPGPNSSSIMFKNRYEDKKSPPGKLAEDEQHIDVECETDIELQTSAQAQDSCNQQALDKAALRPDKSWQKMQSPIEANNSARAGLPSSLILVSPSQRSIGGYQQSLKRAAHSQQPQVAAKRFSANDLIHSIQQSVAASPTQQHAPPSAALGPHFHNQQVQARLLSHQVASKVAGNFQRPLARPEEQASIEQPALVGMFGQQSAADYQQVQARHTLPIGLNKVASSSGYQLPVRTQTGFPYSRLYNQLAQSEQTHQQQPNQQQQQQQQQHQQQNPLAIYPFGSPLDAQLAIRHHLWSNLLAGLRGDHK